MNKNNLAKNTILLSIGTLMTKGINLLMIPLFSSWLSTEDYGTFDIFCTYVSLLIPFITLSSSDAIFRFSVEKESDIEKARYISSGFFISLINCLITVLMFVLGGIFFKWNLVFPFIILLVSELFCNHLQGFMRAIKKLNIYSLSSVVTTSGIAVFVTIFVLVYNMGLTGIIYGYACGYIIGVIVQVVATKYWRYLNLRLVNKKTVAELIKYAYPLIPNNISWWIINVSDRTLIKLFLGASFNGIYAIAYKIPNFCASIFNMFSISWQEAAVELVDSDERNIYYNKIYNNTITTMISLCGGLLGLNYFLFRFIFDVRYYNARLYSPILISSVIFGCLTQYFGGIQISLKKTKENGLTTMIGAVVNIVIDVLFIKSIGLYAAAVSTIAANVVICILRYARLSKEIHFSLKKETILCIAYYIYIFIMAYISNTLMLSVVNLGITCVVFCIINRDFIKHALKKLNFIRG